MKVTWTEPVTETRVVVVKPRTCVIEIPADDFNAFRDFISHSSLSEAMLPPQQKKAALNIATRLYARIR